MASTVSGSSERRSRCTSVRAQSIVSEIDGAFFRSSWRMDRTTWAIWVARSSSTSGTRARTISRSRSTSG